MTSVVRFCLPRRIRRSTPPSSACRMRCTGARASTMRNRVSRRLLLLGATLGLFAGLLPSARARDRTVNFYNWSNYVAPGVLEDFARETGIKVVYDSFDANETLETKLLAGKSGYDVVAPTAVFPATPDRAAHVFQKLDPSKLPNLEERLGLRHRQARVVRSRQSTRRELHVGHHRHRLQRRCGEEDPRRGRCHRQLGRRVHAGALWPSSRIAASTCSIPPTTFCRRRWISRPRPELDQEGRSRKGRRARRRGATLRP